MKKIWKYTLIIGTLVGAIAIGLLAYGPVTNALADDAPTPEGFFPPYGRRFPGKANLADRGQYLADTLGITLEELKAAYEATNEAAVELALEEGVITQGQADAMNEHDIFKPMIPKYFDRRGIFGETTDATYDDLLADALGITVDELNEAREAAKTEAVENGIVPQEMFEMAGAWKALAQSIDREEMMTEGLGITVDELQAYREEGMQISDILEELGIDPAEFAESVKAELAEVIEQAVEDGALTEEQAEMILNMDLRRLGHPQSFMQRKFKQFRYPQGFDQPGWFVRPVPEGSKFIMPIPPLFGGGD